MAPLRNQMPPWHEHVVLANGRDVLIRPIRPADAGPLRASFALLTPEEVRQRFLHTLTEMTEEMAHKLANPDPRSEFALVAAEPLPPGEALLGAVARLAIEPGTRHAEFAILVSRYVAGMGLGRRMMGRLVRWAKTKRLERLHGDVLDGNQPMLALAHALGFTREHGDSPGLVRVTLDLRQRR
ncbi:MAG: GNAT family N-acetyltransferase [Luteimonas sp.]|nr:GNAT family N-acetyltransferase [Luteimonas sp.]